MKKNTLPLSLSTYVFINLSSYIATYPSIYLLAYLPTYILSINFHCHATPPAGTKTMSASRQKSSPKISVLYINKQTDCRFRKCYLTSSRVDRKC